MDAVVNTFGSSIIYVTISFIMWEVGQAQPINQTAVRHSNRSAPQILPHMFPLKTPPLYFRLFDITLHTQV